MTVDSCSLWPRGARVVNIKPAQASWTSNQGRTLVGNFVEWRRTCLKADGVNFGDGEWFRLNGDAVSVREWGWVRLNASAVSVNEWGQV